MNATSSLENLIQDFHIIYRPQIISSGEALLSGDTDGLNKLIDSISKSSLVSIISNAVNTVSANVMTFVREIENASPALKVIFGGIVAGVGGVAIAEAVGLAAALGISILSVKVIAIALIILGICTALPAVWELALRKFDSITGDLNL